MNQSDDETTMPGVHIVEMETPSKDKFPVLAIVFFGKAITLTIILVIYVLGNVYWGWGPTMHILVLP